MTRTSWSERVYRVLLRAYPRRFRARHGGELVAHFREQRRERAYRGAGGALRFWRDIGWDWARSVVAARRGAGAQGRVRARDGVAGTWTERTGTGTGGVVMDAVRQDLGFAVRSLVRAPAFTAVTVLTLAIGIGANAAIFGVVKGVLLEPLPYGEPDEVVTIWSGWNDAPKLWVSEAEYRTYVTQTRAFEDVAIWNEVHVTFTDPERPERVAAVGATENLTRVLGVPMQHGRFFTREEALRADSASADVIVISHEAWMRRWSGDPGAVGGRTEVNGRMREIIGVLPAGFRLPTQFATSDVADVYFPRWVPRTPVEAYPEMGGSHFSYVAARLRDGVGVAEARAEVERSIERVHAEAGSYPPESGFRPLVLSAREDVLGTMGSALGALWAAVGFVLLIACANVANLMLARSDDRADELAVRAALGAGRGRITLQLVLESLVLATAGALAGLLLAHMGVDALTALGPGNLPRVGRVGIDGGVLAFTAAITVGASLLFGVWPALRATASRAGTSAGRRATAGVARSRWRSMLVSIEVALALVLVVGATLMARTFTELTAIETGFDAERTLTLAVSLPTTRYPDGDASSRFYRETLERIERLPGVLSAGAIRSLPLTGRLGDYGVDVEGYDETVLPRASAEWQIAAPGYWESMGIPLVRGRTFTWTDDGDAPAVVIVDESFVRRFWPGQDPIGRRFRVSGDGPWATVVGVVGDVRHGAITDEPLATFYVPAGQWRLMTRGNPTSLRLVVAAEVPPADLVEPVRSVVREMDPSLAVAEIRTVDELTTASVAQPRFMVVLMGVFSAIALVLALVGVYGVIAYGVGRRTREIGVRMALGAMHDQVVGLMLRRGAAMVGVGLVAGTVLALALARFLESLLYGVEPTDPLTFATVIVGFAIVAAAATYLPSRRAARIDPMLALKTD